MLVDKLNNNRAQKEEFVAIYKKARSDAIAARNIRSGYKVTRIYPLDPEKILSKFGEVWWLKTKGKQKNPKRL